MIKILLVEDDVEKANRVKQVLKEAGIFGSSIEVSDNVTSAKHMLSKVKFDILILDLNLPINNKQPPQDNGGNNILYSLSKPQYITPKSVIGLTSYENLKSTNMKAFNNVDFNIYDFLADEWEEMLTNKIKFLRDNLQAPNERISNKKICILVHGVFTDGQWQQDLSSKLNQEWEVIPYRYNYFSAFKIALPLLRQKQEKLFQEYIERTLINNPDSEITIIAHSFGTNLVVKALSNCKLDNLSKIKCIILSGSVVRADFDFNGVIDKYQVDRVVNEVSVNDVPVIISKLFCFGLGHSGRIGFNSSHNKLFNRFHKNGHSIFTHPEFIAKYWEELVNDGKYISADCRQEYPVKKWFENLISVMSPLISWSTIAIIGYIITRSWSF